MASESENRRRSSSVPMLIYGGLAPSGKLIPDGVHPDRRLPIRHLGRVFLEYVSGEEAKLRAGDTIQPLRDGVPRGSFIDPSLTHGRVPAEFLDNSPREAFPVS